MQIEGEYDIMSVANHNCDDWICHARHQDGWFRLEDGVEPKRVTESEVLADAYILMCCPSVKVQYMAHTKFSH